jgi:hypothetical protein
MPFDKGKSGNPAGKPKGAKNRLTRTVKETILEVFNIMQDDPKGNLLAFAKRYPRDFYAIAARLIPTEVTGTVKTKITVSISDE